jgi:hypothetical protein
MALLFKSRAVARVANLHLLGIVVVLIRSICIAWFPSRFIPFSVLPGLSRQVGREQDALTINQPVYVGHLSSSAVAVNRGKRPEKPFSSWAWGGTPVSRRR